MSPKRNLLKLKSIKTETAKVPYIVSSIHLQSTNGTKISIFARVESQVSTDKKGKHRY